MIAAARVGLGRIQVPPYHVETDLADGTLVEVLPQLRPTPTPVSLLYPRCRQLSPRMRVFIDWVTQESRPAHPLAVPAMSLEFPSGGISG